MKEPLNTVTRNYVPEFTLQTNSVIRNTYILLSLTLLFSAATAIVGMNFPINVNPMLFMIVYMGLFFLTAKLQDSPLGLVAVFALTGFLGFTLGPMLNHVIYGFSNGSQIVSLSLGLTGMIFLGLSGYALTTRKDFSYLYGFLSAGAMVVFFASIATLFLNIPMMYIIIASASVLISSGFILYNTSAIINGGVTNYIMATVMLYVQVYNLFQSLLMILSSISGRRD